MKYQQKKKAVLLLAEGTAVYGKRVGYEGKYLLTLRTLVRLW